VKLFDIRIKTTWFIPGHSIATFPLQMQIVANVGHEIGIFVPAWWAEAMNKGGKS
jgi:peptidoglycan/xylan/chitin deacetylase (PgdA/CDA1 family)